MLTYTPGQGMRLGYLPHCLLPKPSGLTVVCRKEEFLKTEGSLVNLHGTGSVVWA